jgi:hypothetical protein
LIVKKAGGIIGQMQTYLIWLFHYIVSSAFKFLYLPVVFCDGLLTDLRLEWVKLDSSLAASTTFNVEQVLPFLKWATLLVVVAGAVLLLVLVTVKGILFDGLNKKSWGAIVGDFLILAMVLFLYYFIFASVVYFFFYIILPMH